MPADVNYAFVAALFAAEATIKAKDSPDKAVADVSTQKEEDLKPYRSAAGFLAQVPNWPSVNRSELAFKMHEDLTAKLGAPPPFNARMAVEMYIAIKRSFR